MITIDEINAGLTQGEFFLEYLPTVSLAEGRCVGAEVLARWRRPSGLVLPNEFIPLIEETTTAGPFTHWVIETVAKELREWLETHEETCISINIPPILLGRGGLWLAVQKAGLEGCIRKFMIEITERGVPDRIGIAALQQASQDGLRVALDDVTLNGANLAVLTRCSLDVIKLDQSLISQITPECPCPEWLSGLTSLLQSTKMVVIAEGVETKEQAVALRASGIPMAQGYYFSRPILVDDFKAYYSNASAILAKPAATPNCGGI